MYIKTRRTLAPAVAAAGALLLLSACGDSEEETESAANDADVTDEVVEDEDTESDEDTDSTDDSDEDVDDADEDTDDATAEGGADDEGAAGEGAEWAEPVTEVGDSLGTIELGDVTVEVFQVAQDQATRDSVWADPESEEPIVQEGDDVVVLNYVVTNNGDPVYLSYGLVEASMGYDSWPYMQQPSVEDTSLLEEHDVNSNGVNSDSIGEDAYLLGTGDQYSVGEVILHQPGEDYTISADFTPRDDAGERDGDAVEGELTGTME